jgi:hypothetical protein
MSYTGDERRDRRIRFDKQGSDARVTGANIGYAKPEEAIARATRIWRKMTNERKERFDKVLTERQKAKVLGRGRGYRKLNAHVPAYQPPQANGDYNKVVKDARAAFYAGSREYSPSASQALRDRSASAERFLKWIDVQSAILISSAEGIPIADRSALQWGIDGSSPDYPFLPPAANAKFRKSQFDQVQGILKKAQEEAKKQAENDAEMLQDIRRENTQCTLLNSIDRLVAINGLYTTRNDKVKKTQSSVNPDNVISYMGSPAKLLHKLINPYDSCAFVHARPSELSALVPKINFYISDQEGFDVPVIFSDHVDGEKLLDLANVRAGGSLKDVLSATDQLGLNVGIKEFDWVFENKDEGDTTVKASLKLYFGSLSELVNQYYLRFLFTTGQPTAHVDSSTKAQSQGQTPTKAERKRKLEQTLKGWESNLSQGGPQGSATTKVKNYTDETHKNNFSQLKAMVGWSAPEGERFSSGDQPLYSQDFLDSLPYMRKTLLLNMTSYDLDFKEEGQVELTIEYVASIDSFYSKSTSDILRGSAIAEKPLDDRFIYLPQEASSGFRDWWSGKKSRESKLYDKGYLKRRLKAGKKGKLKMTKPSGKGDEEPAFTANAKGALFEIEYLRLRLEYVKEFQPNDKDLINGLELNIKEAEIVYQEIKTSLRGQRYTSFLEAIIAKGNLFVVGVRGPLDGDPSNPKSKGVVKTDFKLPAADEGALNETIRLIAAGESDQIIETRALDPSERKRHAGFELRPGTIPVFYMRLGDIVDTAIRNMGINREDTNVVLGSFLPNLAGMPSPIKGTTLSDKYYSLADLPVSFDYFGHWFMEHVVSKERETYPFRHFMNDLMNGLVADVVNFICPESQTRISVDFTSVSTQTNFRDKATFQFTPLVTGADFNNIVKTPPQVSRPVNNNFVVYAKQLDPARRVGDRKMDEEEGIYHLILGADTGILKGVTFSEKSMPQYRAMKIEASNKSQTESAGALVLPQDASCRLFGNSLFQNGQLVYINAELGLGKQAANALRLGGYYRIYRVENSITLSGYETSLELKYDDPRRIHTKQ